MKNKSLLLLFLLHTVLSLIIEPKVLLEIKKNKKANILIELSDRINFNHTHLETLDWITRGRLVYKLLTEKAETTQKGIRKILDKNHLEYTNLWIQNTISVNHIPENVLLELSTEKSIKNIKLDTEERAVWEQPDPLTHTVEQPKAPEPGISWIKAPESWSEGYTGKGIILATQDSGVYWNHNALKSSYRGNHNGEISHDFNWYDPVERRRQPIDQNGHGTHVQGIVTGGVARQIGVAPDAKWIHCRVANQTFVASKVIACWQFTLAPHDLNGNGANPDLRPHVCSNSYNCEYCELNPSLEAHKAAGIITVGSIGNRGSGCKSTTYPGNHPITLAVGALALKSHGIAYYSSRGPTESGILKPSFVVPGTQVTSASIRGVSTYVANTGTSMAAPHMNGAVGLLLQAVPQLMGKRDKIETAFRETAFKQVTTDCSSSGSPNNVYGYGSIDVSAAIRYAIRHFNK